MIKDIFKNEDIIITKDDFISFDIPLVKQKDSLYEDMFQATNNTTNITLDIGWYGDTQTLEGNFIVHLIKDNNWDVPILKIFTKDLALLKYYIESTVFYFEDNLRTEKL